MYDKNNDIPNDHRTKRLCFSNDFMITKLDLIND